MVLPSDVLLLIFDYVTLKTDLKAICEVSKGYHELAVPLLYQEVCLTTADYQEPKLKRFLQCVAAGASAHIHHTRSLILEGSAPPMQPLPINWDEEEHYEHRKEVTRLILQVLEIFPENRLHTFEFITTRSISLAMLRILNKRHKCLKRMRFTWGDDWNRAHWEGATAAISGDEGDGRDEADHEDDEVNQRSRGEAPPVFDGLLALDVILCASEGPENTSYMEQLVEAFLASNPSLERLHVGSHITQTPLRQEIIADGFATALSAAARTKPITFPRLKEFAISDIEFFSENAGYWHQFVPFEKLQRLSIFLDGEEDRLINYLNKEFTDDQLNLKHLRLDVQMDNEVIPLLNSCKPLTTLHIMMDLMYIFDTFMASLRKHGDTLRTLAIAQSFTDDPTITRIGREQFKELCRVCHNLHFLSIGVADQQVDPTNWIEDGKLEQRLIDLGSMRGLRLIHFRVSQMKWLGIEAHKAHAQTGTEMQEFARAVFDFMDAHGACIHLRSIVMGSHYDTTESCGGARCYPRHCFVKEYQPDDMGVPKVAAVQVPAYRIRDMEPDCDLFEFDPSADWIGTQPGRLRF